MHVGIDTNSFGFAARASHPMHIDRGATRRWSNYGWVVAAGDYEQRLQTAHSAMRHMCESLRPGAHLWVEEPLLLRTNKDTTRKLMTMGGVLYGAFLQACPDAFWHWVDVATWRKRLLGKGSGSTEEMKGLARAFALARYGEVVPSGGPDDLYDAACLLAYGESVAEALGV